MRSTSLVSLISQQYISVDETSGAQTYCDREPGVGHEAKILCWTALRHDCRCRRTEGVYDSILQSFHAFCSSIHV